MFAQGGWSKDKKRVLVGILNTRSPNWFPHDSETNKIRFSPVWYISDKVIEKTEKHSFIENPCDLNGLNLWKKLCPCKFKGVVAIESSLREYWSHLNTRTWNFPDYFENVFFWKYGQK